MDKMSKRTTDTITLGSGILYVAEFSGTIPEDETLEVDTNRLGWIKGGAQLQYTPEYYTAEDDLGKVKKQKITKEEVILTSGIMTWNGKVLEKLTSTGTSTEASEKRTTKIGGVGNDNGKSYVLRFVHEDATDGDVRVTIVGKNTSGFTLAFASDNETVIDAQFTALPNDSKGTLIIIEEEMDATA